MVQIKSKKIRADSYKGLMDYVANKYAFLNLLNKIFPPLNLSYIKKSFIRK